MPAVSERPAKRRPANGHALLTSEQFLDWLEPGVHADLIGGEIFMHSPVNLNHARLVNFVERLLAAYIEEHDLGELHRETVAIRLSPRETFLPDLSYFTKAQAGRLGGSHVAFAPALVVEVLSPGTAQNDTGRKFAAYELHGVQEYWILDPKKLEHRFYWRVGDVFEEFSPHDETVRSFALPGFWLKRAWLSPAKLPTVASCLAAIRKSERGSRR